MNNICRRSETNNQRNNLPFCLHNLFCHSNLPGIPKSETQARSTQRNQQIRNVGRNGEENRLDNSDHSLNHSRLYDFETYIRGKFSYLFSGQRMFYCHCSIYRSAPSHDSEKQSNFEVHQTNY